MIAHIFDFKFSPLQPIVLLLSLIPFAFLGLEQVLNQMELPNDTVNYGVIVYFWIVCLCKLNRLSFLCGFS